MTLLDRVATAPISWGVCEVPGWGEQLPVELVLAEMSELGFTHTELGAFGYLPTDPVTLQAVLAEHGLALLGGFVPLVLHDSARADDAMASADAAAALLASAGASYFVTAVVSDPADWRRPRLSDAAWQRLLERVDQLDDVVAGHGLTQVVHPHVGTLVETADEVRRLLSHTGAALCLDTAHLTIGGTDVIALVGEHRDRIGLVHLKDVDLGVAHELQVGSIGLLEAVRRGVFPPLGRGEVPITEIVTSLEASGHGLWYVLEQDTAIIEGDPSAAAGPKLDARVSIEFLRSLDLATVGTAGGPGTRSQEG